VIIGIIPYMFVGEYYSWVPVFHVHFTIVADFESGESAIVVAGHTE